MEGFKPYGWYLTLVQFAFYSIFGLIELQLIQDKRRRYVLRLPVLVESERKKKKNKANMPTVYDSTFPANI